jgi:hypothetical protein
MHDDDERAFELELLAEHRLQFVDGPRWPTSSPPTSRSLASLRTSYCIIWDPVDLAVLQAKYIESVGDWYCRSEAATIQFLRSTRRQGVVTEGRIAVSTSEDLSTAASAAIAARYKRLRRYIQKNYTNKVVRWCNPSLPLLPAGPQRSANPSDPDAQLWVGPRALSWLRQDETHRIKQFLQSIVEARLVVP